MNKKTKNIIKLIRNNVNQIDPTADIFLYGSRARGNFRKDSDWDILILTNEPTNIKKEDEFCDNLYELGLETEEFFSVFTYSKNDWNKRKEFLPFFKNVLEEGIII